MPGFPKNISTSTDKKIRSVSNLVVCDLRGDSKKSVYFAADDSRLYSVNLSGQSTPGFPLLLAEPFNGHLLCQGTKKSKVEFLWGITTSGHLLKISDRGRIEAVLKNLGGNVESGIAAADFSGADDITLVLGTHDGQMLAIDKHGQMRSGFPYVMGYKSRGPPVLGDIDGDGFLDIVVASQDYYVHAIDRNGKSLKGFPLQANYRFYAPPSLTDRNYDGVFDVVSLSGNGDVFYTSGTGENYPDFPIKNGYKFYAQALSGDLDGDGELDLIALTHTGKLLAWDLVAQIKDLSTSFRLPKLSYFVLTKFVHDDVLKIVAQSDDGHLFVLQMQDVGSIKNTPLPWPMPGQNIQSTSRVTSHATQYKGLSFKKNTLRTIDDLSAQFIATDADFDAIRNYQIRWFKNAAHVPDFNNKTTIAASTTHKHDQWYYTLQDDDNYQAYGENTLFSRTTKSPTMMILNTEPSKPTIDLTPLHPNTQEPLALRIVKQSLDDDNDSIQYKIKWERNGTAVDVVADQTMIEAEITQKHDVWRVSVTPFDGEAFGESATKMVKIINTPPSSPQISLPATIASTETLKATILMPSVDVDGDEVHYNYRYFVNKELLPVPLFDTELDVVFYKKHDVIRVEVTPIDGEVFGKPIMATTRVANSLPGKPNVALIPRVPRRGQDVVAKIAWDEDHDHDSLSIKHQWYLNGKRMTIPLGITKNNLFKHQQWQLEVQLSDGNGLGPMERANFVVENTPPEPCDVTLPHYQFYTDETITPIFTWPAKDIDPGDKITLNYEWFLQGELMPFQSNKKQLTPKETEKNQSWKVSITPTDGQDLGEKAVLQFSIINTPPTRALVEFTLPNVKRNDDLRVVIKKHAEDRDNDVISYRYRWYKNDEWQEDLPVTQDQVSGTRYKKNERWRVEVSAWDGQNESDRSTVELYVKNASPQAPVVTLNVKSATGENGGFATMIDYLECVVTKAAVDVDGDTINHHARWYKNGKIITSLANSNSLAVNRYFKKGDTISCMMMVDDGSEAVSSLLSNLVEIKNSFPTRPEVSIFPGHAKTIDDLYCAITKPSTDIDHDAITYQFQWYVDGERLTIATRPEKNTYTTVQIPQERTSRGQQWTCEVTATDGVVVLESVRAITMIENSLPKPPQIELIRDTKTTPTTLRCDSSGAASDADGDQLNYAYRWYRNDVLQEFATTSTAVPERLLNVLDVWRCELMVTDQVGGESHAVSKALVIGG